MLSRGEREQGTDKERSKRQERAERILDAAGELLRRWGYKKTTLDDISKQAGVAKGTIYLHWKSREALFEELILREWRSILEDLRQRLANDPTGVMLSSLTRHVVSIAVGNLLMLLSDTETLGELRRSNIWQDIVKFRMETTKIYLEQLRSEGLLRTDTDVQTQLKMMSAICTGFFVVNPLMPPDSRFSPEEMVEALAETLHRTFEPEEPPAPEALKRVTQAFTQVLDRYAELLERKYNESKL
ncbi:TetR/AcrR family transcriptional regulator [Ktedonosporobacter rubrisoli]|uniref:TetR/AcrR family transcriptional regulator n=1 Tax=Ktedonosporobacter rubrisoli TaxID=2509675 RepID=A0A4P6JX56_KTERU|nr:TetR/AcrR family transcriptional regulator [Ktedonosporobacter rubrisoli]QBD80204.1 TetR/AcrR family transcriptional regulator [Ktedonosporobacter rubrisoli]